MNMFVRTTALTTFALSWRHDVHASAGFQHEKPESGSWPSAIHRIFRHCGWLTHIPISRSGNLEGSLFDKTWQENNHSISLLADSLSSYGWFVFTSNASSFNMVFAQENIEARELIDDLGDDDPAVELLWAAIPTMKEIREFRDAGRNLFCFTYGMGTNARAASTAVAVRIFGEKFTQEVSES